jgi:hypothetical protein
MMNLGLLDYMLPEIAEEQEQMIVYSLSAGIHSIFVRHMIISNLNFRLYFFILLSISLSFTASGQKLKGIVINSETNEPLSYVNIGVEGKNVGIISDDKGEFILDLSKIQADDHIQFSMIGYEAVRIKNPKGNQEKLRIKLMPITYDLETMKDPNSA